MYLEVPRQEPIDVSGSQILTLVKQKPLLSKPQDELTTDKKAMLREQSSAVVQENDQESEEADDPKDGNFGAPPTRRRMKAGTRIVSAGSKRKSGDGSVSETKRPRLHMPSQDGAADSEQMGCPPGGKLL